MMKLEILEEFTASNDQMIVKGKPTKRPRPSSSASSNGGEYDGAGEFCNSLVSSPAPTSSTTTEEDEDMANCLILLARGNSPPLPAHSKSAADAAENKFSSRRFAEMATTAAGKVGIFVYECKTCNRTFPSFQALGGHRASHKKPKTDAEAAPPSPPPHAQEEREGKQPLKKSSSIISPPQSDPSKPKMHECSICGSEFGSGQALGGHMRRHRPAPKIPTSIDGNTTSSNVAADMGRSILALDLNLPAPPDDDKLQQFPAERQRRVDFSAAALVGCHY